MKTLVPSNGDSRAVLVTPRGMSLGQGTKFSAKVNRCTSPESFLPTLETPHDSKGCRTGEDGAQSKAVPATVRSIKQPCLCCKV